MRWMISILIVIACALQIGAVKKPGLPPAITGVFTDTVNNTPGLANIAFPGNSIIRSSFTLEDLDQILQEDKNMQFSLGQSKEGRNVNAYYIPGTSKQRALVLAGVHGSELSAIEVAYHLVRRLLQQKQPYYSVIIVPCLFPDNAMKAMNEPERIGTEANVGRYSYTDAVDPNRQMPSPGKDYDETNGLDHLGRKIEQENLLLLQLIRAFKPQRIANIHAIKDTSFGGVYADPRTNHKSIALGYSTDSSLALEVASFIHKQGGRVAGNNLIKKPTALYYKDPPPAPAGNYQTRNLTGSVLSAARGKGTSLGTWASTAIVNEKDSAKSREAMRILTIEYPGYKRAADYKREAKQLSESKQAELFAEAVETIFLGNYFTERKTDDYVKN